MTAAVMSAVNFDFQAVAPWNGALSEAPPSSFSTAANATPTPTQTTSNDLAFQTHIRQAANLNTYQHLLPHPDQGAAGAGRIMSPRARLRGAQLHIKTGKIKRSMSTPNVRGQASAAETAAAILEKRRNKLGYHRTSVACGHCRRRKIRCILSPADHESRCINCIRLKKECQFYPVEQEAALAQDATQCKSRAQSSEMASNLPSPTTPSSQLQEIQPPTVFFSQMAMPTLTELNEPQIKEQGVEGLSPISTDTGTLPHQEHIPYESYPHTNWMASKFSPMTALSSGGGDGAGGIPEYLGGGGGFPQESPITPGFSPFTPTLPHHAVTWSAHPESSGNKDVSWNGNLPQRSISYSNLEGLSHHHQQQHQQYVFSPVAPQATIPSDVQQRSGMAGSMLVQQPPDMSTGAVGGHLGPDSHAHLIGSDTHGHLGPDNSHTHTASTPASSTHRSNTGLSGSISSASSYGSWHPQQQQQQQQQQYDFGKTPVQSDVGVESHQGYVPWHHGVPQVPSQGQDMNVNGGNMVNMSGNVDYTFEPQGMYYPQQ